jgi:hypothetical protein
MDTETQAALEDLLTVTALHEVTTARIVQWQQAARQALTEHGRQPVSAPEVRDSLAARGRPEGERPVRGQQHQHQHQQGRAVPGTAAAPEAPAGVATSGDADSKG